MYPAAQKFQASSFHRLALSSLARMLSSLVNSSIQEGARVGPNALQKCMAELIGTFALTFIGVGSIIVGTLPGASLNLLQIAIAFGLAVATIVSATGHISGGHINPAVTCSIMATKRMSPALGIGYIIAQLVGSTI